ncbi:dihydroorotate oxidase B, catalytic subunit [Syntrophobotulus glycolicus DSM 8271]|uniref:Dihydroorotate dehydrogenase B (NAD(+)), catalytic subunit n=1 Tax=Syntrophobotulus glycolicus (strain DSM 8271 / FlGlyR) TaxID=645991 RepID=F0SVX7_SYNGF|nr:NAD-dependent dihydropyrimidine dehydrogenase subunit PreA [Syntrophobotulus glycolicus]ADY55683.1 dihydroorotate oxidase B, catalytic subunit [Syntrophobotulus glycolicus DSM 8271]
MRETIRNQFSAKSEADSCLLCYTAPCTANCPHGLDAAKLIRSLRFKHIPGGADWPKCGDVCGPCESQDCTEACLRGKMDRPVRIPELIEYVRNLGQSKFRLPGKINLGIEFCGIPCENPFFLSSSVVASNYTMVAKAFEMGWAGAVFKTIGTFVPQEVSPRFSSIGKEGNSFSGFKNIEQISDHTLEENLEFMSRLKRDFPHKVVVASILGQDEEEWTFLARKVTEAGVDIIECNFSCPHMTGEGLGSDVGQSPELVALYTAATRKGTDLPILAKMTPNIGNMEIPAIAAMENGATGIAAINTIKSIMNINLDDFVSEPRVDGKSCVGGYSGKTVKPIALRFIHDMKKHPKLKECPISGMGGIETWRDAAEFIAMGCANVQITTSVMQYGYRIIEDFIDGLTAFLSEKGYHSLQEIIGLALPNVVQADQLNRNSISYPKFDFHKCLGCGRCYLSCYDGGHQALEIAEENGRPKLMPKKCVGCQLCTFVCPAGAISSSTRVNA